MCKLIHCENFNVYGMALLAYAGKKMASVLSTARHWGEDAVTPVHHTACGYGRQTCMGKGKLRPDSPPVCFVKCLCLLPNMPMERVKPQVSKWKYFHLHFLWIWGSVAAGSANRRPQQMTVSNDCLHCYRSAHLLSTQSKRTCGDVCLQCTLQVNVSI